MHKIGLILFGLAILSHGAQATPIALIEPDATEGDTVSVLSVGISELFIIPAIARILYPVRFAQRDYRASDLRIERVEGRETNL